MFLPKIWIFCEVHRAIIRAVTPLDVLTQLLEKNDGQIDAGEFIRQICYIVDKEREIGRIKYSFIQVSLDIITYYCDREEVTENKIITSTHFKYKHVIL